MNQTSRNELLKYMKQYNVDFSIADVTPTICALHGVTPPECCGGTAIAEVVDQAGHLTGDDKKIEKSLIFCPDAAGEIQRQHYPELFERVEKLAGMKFLSSGVMPSVTPVCFATIFSGASPEEHGIREYCKPVLSSPTLFDVLAEAGKNIAIISVNKCSIDTIFRRRNVDYYSLRTDELCHRTTRRLIAEGEYDIIISYYMNYDKISHKKGGFSEDAHQALATAVEYFETLVEDTERYWGKYNRSVSWISDHGNHEAGENQSTHGKNIPEDMLVNHFYRVCAAE